tara:strand:+ start:410 stop:523 length:114 start_codon:yes stop_codon:yes gene_type:complete
MVASQRIANLLYTYLALMISAGSDKTAEHHFLKEFDD